MPYIKYTAECFTKFVNAWNENTESRLRFTAIKKKFDRSTVGSGSKTADSYPFSLAH